MKKILMSLALIATGLFVTGCLKPEVTPEMQAKIETAEATGKYVTYSTAVESEVKGNAPYILFFHAPWCGTCVNWEQKVVSAIDTLPDNTKIFKVDYDTQASEFGVKSQSTALFFDASGTQVDSVLDPSVAFMSDFFNGSFVNSPATEVSTETEEEKAEESAVEATENLENNSEKTGEVVEVVAPIQELSVTIEENDETEIEVETKEALPAFKYADFSVAERNALHGKQKYGIYFHADWCPTCVAYEKKIKARASEFPNGSILFKADYDTESMLKRDFGVATQTTFVVIDHTGKIVYKRVNPSFEDLVAQF